MYVNQSGRQMIWYPIYCKDMIYIVMHIILLSSYAILIW
jgi:hypothetical protein